MFFFSQVIPLINTVKNVLENTDFQGSGLLGMKNDLLASLKRRYSDVEGNYLYAAASLLDPRFRSAPFLDSSCFEQTKAKIIEEMMAVSEAGSISTEEPQEEPLSSAPGTSKPTKGLWSYYKDYFTKGEQVSGVSSSCDSELNQYLGEKNLDPKDGEKVSHYWTNSVYPTLKRAALKYLCVPPCTVFSERLFSTAGNICDQKRNRLDPERIKMIVFLNKNLE